MSKYSPYRIFCCVFLAILLQPALSGEETRIREAPKSAYERVAGVEAPEGCPFEKSRAFAGVGFTRRHAEYTEADTWYPSWAADGKLYSPRTVARIQLFDRPTELAQMTGGLLVFSDGTTIRVGALPDDARQGLEIRFPPKRVKWLLLAIDAVKPGTTNVGLSEMAVFAR